MEGRNGQGVRSRKCAMVCQMCGKWQRQEVSSTHGICRASRACFHRGGGQAQHTEGARRGRHQACRPTVGRHHERKAFGAVHKGLQLITDATHLSGRARDGHKWRAKE